jgi:hypothetical protein
MLKALVDPRMDSLDDARFATSYYLSPEVLLLYRLASLLWLLGIFITCLFKINQLINFGVSVYYNLTYFTMLSW